MKYLKNKCFKLLNNYFPILFFILLILIFFWKFFIKGHVPIPFDFVVGTYFPWLDYKWGGYGAGVPVKNPLLADVPSLIYPLRIYAIHLIKNGIFPLWNDLQFAGYPLMANFQASVLNPFNVLFFLFKDHIAWSIEVMLQPFLTMVFTYLFLKDLGLKRYSSILGSVVYAFSGFNMVWLTYNVHGFVASTIPLLLFIVNKLISKNKIYWGIIFSLTLCIQIFFGYPQLTLYSILLVGFWTLIRNYKKLPVVALYGILGLLLSSIQLLPGYELLRNSQRVIEGVSGGDNVAFLQYKQLINLFIPDFFGNPATYNYWGSGNYTNFAGYSGIVAILLSILIIFVKKANKAVSFFRVVFVLSLILALPNFISRFILSSSIFGSGAATSTRILVLFNFSIAVLSAFGIEYLEKEKSKINWGIFLLPVIAILGIIISLYFKFIDFGIIHTSVALRNSFYPLLISILLFLILIIWKKCKISFAKYLILLLIILELFRFGWKFTPFSDPMLEYPKTPIFEKLETIDTAKFRINEGDTIPISMWIPYGLESLSGYDAIYPLTIAKYISVMNSGNSKASAMGRYGSVDNPNSKLFDLANIKYLVAIKRDKIANPDPNGIVFYKYRLNKFVKIFEDKSVAILENKDVLPRIFFVSDWEIIKEDEKVLDQLLNPKFDLRRKIILSDNFNEFTSESTLPKYEISNVEYKSGRITLNLTNDKNGFIFISDTYYPGWECYIDGKKTNIYRADYTFRAVPVTKGEHNILFIYNPKSFRMGKMISVSILLVLFLLFIYGYKKIGEDLHEHVPANWYFESLKKDRLQKLWHTTRFREIKKVATPAEKVLDIGCADGVFSNVILKSTKTKSLIGLDIVKTSIAWAKKHWKNPKMRFLVGDAHKLEFPKGTFDAVFIMEVLEHVADPRLVLKEVKRVLKKGGYAVFLVPSDSLLFRIIWFFWLHFYPRGWVWNHTHIQSYRKNFLTKICKQAGFKIEVDKKFNLGMLHLVRVRK